MKDFIEIIKENANTSPNRIAIIDGKSRITYATFANIVNSISHQLIAICPNPKIVFDLKQGVEAYALIVAVLNVGGTYCPINTDAPIERKLQIINGFVPDIIVTDNEENYLEITITKTITIERLLSQNKYDDIQINYDGESIIYIIYTSGTSGESKGVKICRKALNKFLEWSIPTYAANENDIWGQFSFLSFDLSIVDIFTCLCSGSTLFVMNDLVMKKYRPADIIQKEKITIWHSVPSVVEFMIMNEKSESHDYSSLRLMSFCGEPLQKHQVDFLFKKNNKLTVFNTYGPTEGTLFCSWQELKSDTYMNFCDSTVSIGRTIPGWNFKLIEVQDSDEKEIIIYGDFIGKGYLGNIINTNFKTLEIEGKYVNGFETGDFVIEKNKKLYFSCRKDNQVKIRGFRVELDEIDFRINEFLNKTSTTVVKNGSLYSFIESEVKIDVAELKKYLKKKLEPYKIPNTFYEIEETPRSQNHKVNKKSLIELIP
jgi:non-ribosomal peptide synthetase component F